MTLISLDTGQWPKVSPAAQFEALLERAGASYHDRQTVLAGFTGRSLEDQTSIVGRLNADVTSATTSVAAFFAQAGIYNPLHGMGLRRPTTGAWRDQRYSV